MARFRRQRLAALVALVGCAGTEDGREPSGGAAAEGIPTISDSGDDGIADTAVDDGGAKLDLPPGSTGGQNDSGDCPGGGMGGDVVFSNIWIANSPEGTVSKIDTKTGVELARYRTGADASSDPSRTSVNLLGDVAVLNRAGGAVVKIAAREESCVDANNDGAITTSTGPADVLPWLTDECVLWVAPVHPGSRAVAWESGNDPDGADEGCFAPNPRLWVSGMDPQLTVHVYRLDGATGAVLDEATQPNWSDPDWGGLYGGAVDAEGDFWATGKENVALVHVDSETMQLQMFAAQGPDRFYGMAMDAMGYPWIASEFDDTLFRFDIETLQFESKGTTGHESLRGIAIDETGNAWIAANNPCDLVHYDVATATFSNVALAGCGTPVGVSIDVDEFVWVVDQGSNLAYKVDPVARTVVLTVTGLVGPYTYSDMTGAGLDLVTNPPQG
jgi:DNA-binding beta-propeller fold protein YncE